MKKALINYIKKEKFDNLYTPEYAIEPLLKYLPPLPLKIWECCDYGESKISKVLRENGYEVVFTDIIHDFNFLIDTPNFDFDIIVTNPPYSYKNEFLEKCYSYQKPFALLLPLTALEGIERNKMFSEKGISVIVLDKRINFMNQKNEDKKSGCWFNTSWFLYNITENNKLFFEKLNIPKK